MPSFPSKRKQRRENMTGRKTSFGEGYKLTLVDKFGVYLSLYKVRQIIKDFKKPFTCLDIGCGYNAKLLKELAPNIKHGLGIDISINPEIKTIENLNFIESNVEEAVANLEKEQFDLISIMSVLEHLNDPLMVLKECYNHLNPNGILLINVPTWLGKVFLEFSAFKLRLSPFDEMEDHKMYYDKRDLWPLLIKAGFKPSKITMQYHKFGLNLFSIVKK